MKANRFSWMKILVITVSFLAFACSEDVEEELGRGDQHGVDKAIG